MWVCVCVGMCMLGTGNLKNLSGRAERCSRAWTCSDPNVLRSPKMLTPSLKRPRCRALADMWMQLHLGNVMAYGSMCQLHTNISQSMMEALLLTGSQSSREYMWNISQNEVSVFGSKIAT